ncbi:hypothetical protein WSK_4048 [Novosphingobium sp. Rr 2-17]|uniref:hypothetical protein n=1 Tax=Novosphingobium sp. Rr 2-17 TaxID=555793 RepID=UPI0002699C1B|nr:hypothetical protein [Novosphingobium sp. Rr 2-17]EIZ77386.1 hypothetical protein WSK_4048 [Novosphingobium sp. Rr 2-17]
MTKFPNQVAVMLLVGVCGWPALAQAETRSFDGTWQIEGRPDTLRPVDGGAVPLTAAGRETYEPRRTAYSKGDRTFDPVMRSCASPGVPRVALLGGAFEIIDRPQQITFLFGWNHLFRTVPVGKPLSTVGYASAIGTSEAKREDDGLVIDTRELNPATLLDATGLPHGPNLKVRETYRLIDGGERLVLRLRFEDAEIYTRPWEADVTFRRLTDYQLKEDVCLDRIAVGQPAIPTTSARERPK